MVRLVLKWGTLVLIVSCAVASFNQGSVGAVASVWSNTPVVLESSMSRTIVSSDAFSCPTRPQFIAVKGWYEPKSACVFGTSGLLQMARFTGSVGYPVYALKFPFDSEYITFRGMCAVSSPCQYGQAADALIMRTYANGSTSVSLIEDFSRYVMYNSDDGGYYALENVEEMLPIKKGDAIARASAFTVSPGGAWALVELIGSGFLRINLHTLETRRVVAPSSEYGYGMDPRYEMAISNDGNRVAITGERVGLSIYDIVPACGDTYGQTSARHFEYYTPSCPNANFDIASLVQGYYSSHIPEFSPDGFHLSLYVTTPQQQGFVWLAPLAHQQDMSKRQYVALGDSYTSGEGEHDDVFYLQGTNTATNRCHVSSRSYPYLIGQAWNVATLNRACSGARIDGVKEVSHKVAKGEFEGSAPTHISVSIGGNDLNIIGKLKTCLMPGTCEWAKPENRHASAIEIQQLLPRILDLVSLLQSNHPGVALSIVGYPSVVNTTTNASCDMLTDTMLNFEERLYLEEMITYLNLVLKAAATVHTIEYLDIEQSLVGERLCDARPLAMNGVRFGDDIGLFEVKVFGNESFHPTPRGHELEARAILARNEVLWPVKTCDECAQTAPDISPSSYWMAQSGPQKTKTQKFAEFLSSTMLRPKSHVTLSFPAGFFMPFATVRLELHSTPLPLAEFSANEDGSLHTTVQIPEGTAGYHTVHAFSEVRGETIDSYQTVFVSEEKRQQAALAVNRPPSNTSVMNSGGDSPPKSQVQAAVAGVATLSQIKNSVSTGAQGSPRQHVPPVAVFLWAGLALLACIVGTGWYIIWRIRKANYSGELP